MENMERLECRVVIRYLPDGRIRLGAYDPRHFRYEPLGVHGPSVADVDAAVRGLAQRIEREGHLLTFSEQSVKL